MNADIDPLSLLETAKDVAREAGGLVGEIIAEPRELSHKGFRDLVTDADFAAQKLMTDQIRTRYPDHGFLVEETDTTLPATGPVVWIIDPVDGTTNYSRQQPNFCLSIAAATDDAVLAGVIYDPVRDELFAASQGGGSFLNDEPLQVSHVTELEEAIIGLDWSRSEALRQTVLNALLGFAHEVRTIRAIGSAALALAWIAAGRLDGYVNYGLFPWDIAAAELLIHEAGGTVTDPAGRPLVLRDARQSVASNGRIHAAFLKLLQEST